MNVMLRGSCVCMWGYKETRGRFVVKEKGGGWYKKRMEREVAMAVTIVVGW